METRGPEQPHLSKRQAKRARRQARIQQQTQKEPVFGKVVTRRRVIGGLVGLGVAATGIGVYKASQERAKEKSFKEKVLSFTADKLDKPDELRAFVEQAADEYLKATKTPRLTREDLLGKNRTNFYANQKDYVAAVKAANPDNNPTKFTAYTDFTSRQVFIDLESQKKELLSSGGAGLLFLGNLWHEWGHLDVTERREGKLLNNPEIFFDSPNSHKQEMFRRYRGGEVFTDTYFGYKTFEEILNETVNQERIQQTMGFTDQQMTPLLLRTTYYPNGLSVFVPFAKK